jgi:nucleotide-binding universal stress UspA family protein
LRFLAPFNESHTVPVEHIVAAGDAGERIVEYARKFAVDLVVLGSPEGELTEQDLYTSTVLQVVARIGCPVLCLKPPTLADSKTQVALTSSFSL